MTKTTHLLRELEMPTTKFEVVVDDTAPTTQTEDNVCQMPQPAEDPVPENYLSIDDLVSEFESDEETSVALERGRRWVADAFYDDNGDTVRTLRLRKGWSQTQLAVALATSQSHVARIERGTENIYIATCRKLCKALEVDMNTLDESLQRQEAIAQSKVSNK